MIFGGIKCPCGRCMACRINKKRLWTHRILLESYCHSSSLFVTLTYNDEHLPPDLSVHPEDVQKYIKRLRKSLSPKKFRYFLVGEYGDKSWRPHYHLALFGLGIEDMKAVEDAWQKRGFVHIGDITEKSAGYIAGYATKKMTSDKDQRLEGRHPEFIRMSLKPGLGAGFLPRLLDLFKEHDTIGDVPYVLRHGSRILPLGRYLRKLFRKALYDEAYVEFLKQETIKEMQTMLNDKLSSQERLFLTQGAQAYVLEMRLRNEQMDLNMRAKEKVWRNRKL